MLVSFGEFLISKPEGRDAAFVIANHFTRPLEKDEFIELDFAGIKVLTPGWLDEVMQVVLHKTTKERIHCLNTDNLSVSASLEMVLGCY